MTNADPKRLIRIARETGGPLAEAALEAGLASEGADAAIIYYAGHGIEAGGDVLACGTCIKGRGQAESEACPLSTMVDCLEMVEWADKVVTF